MTPLSESLLESVAAAAVREGLADAHLHAPEHAARAACWWSRAPRAWSGSPSRARPRTSSWPRSPRALGPNVIGSDRELATERDALSALPRGRHDGAVAAGRPAADGARRSATRCSRSCARCRAGRPSATASSPRVRATRRPPVPSGTACARNPIPIVVPCHRVLPGHGPARATTAAGRSASARCSSSRGPGDLQASRTAPPSRLPRLDLDVTVFMITWAAGAPSGPAWISPIFVATSMPLVTSPSSA